MSFIFHDMPLLYAAGALRCRPRSRCHAAIDPVTRLRPRWRFELYAMSAPFTCCRHVALRGLSYCRMTRARRVALI